MYAAISQILAMPTRNANSSDILVVATWGKWRPINERK